MEIPSLCLLRVVVSVQNVTDIFNFMWGDCIDHIDVVDKVDYYDRPYQMMFAHFKPVPSNPLLVQFLAQLETGEVKLMYDDPWFWIIRKNTTRKRTDEEVRQDEYEYELCEFNDKADLWDESDDAKCVARYYNDLVDIVMNFKFCYENPTFTRSMQVRAQFLDGWFGKPDEMEETVDDFKAYMIGKAQQAYMNEFDSMKLHYIRKNIIKI